MSIDQFYTYAPAGFASRCSAAGIMFPGILDTQDLDSYDAASTTRHALRYPHADVTLAAGDTVTIAGDDYRVVGLPARINRDEMLAHLALIP